MPRRSTRQNGGVEVEDIPLDNSTLNGDLEPVKGDMKTPTKMNGTPRSVKKQKKDIKDVILKDRLKELNDSTHMDGNIQDKVKKEVKATEEPKTQLPVNASTSNIDPLGKTETTEEIRSNSLAVLLSQGLTSGDAEKIDAVLSKTDAHIITTTLSELPKTQIIPLLKQIEFRFRNRKTLDIRCWARWVQYTVSIHATYLSTIGCLENELSTLYSWMRTRCAHVGSLYETHGKLMLMVEQIERRANPNFFVFQQPMAFFNEDETASENSEDSDEIEENESVPSDEDWWDDEDIASEHNDMPSDKESSSSDEEEESDNEEDQESSEEDVGEMMKRQEGSDNEMDVE